MIKIATVFSGVGTPEYALKSMGMDFKSVFACDIDKYARQTFKANHDTLKMYEDVTLIDGNHYKGMISLFVGGSPCQSFSIAGKRGGFDDTRGTLFYEYARLVKEMQPEVFIWENVKGVLSHDNGKTFRIICNTFIDLGYHSTYQVLNTKHYGVPQNRERVYVVGFKSKEDYLKFEFPTPFKLEQRLKDVLEPVVDEKYYLSEKMQKYVQNAKYKDDRPISIDKVAPCQKVGGDVSCFEDKIIKEGYVNQDTQASQVYSADGVSPSLNAGTHGYAQGYIKDVVCHNLQPRSGDPKKGGTGHLSKQDGTSYALDTGCSSAVEIVPMRWGRTEKGKQLRRENKDKGTDYTPFSDGCRELKESKEEVSGCITSALAKDSLLKHSNRIRKLTPRECARLQGFKDNLVLPCSDTQSYKQMGNGMSVNVLEQLYIQIYKQDSAQPKLF